MDNIVQATVKTRDAKNHLRIYSMSQLDLDSIKLRKDVIIHDEERVVKVEPELIVKPNPEEKPIPKKDILKEHVTKVVKKTKKISKKPSKK